MLLGVIADDFTGASDVANTISKGLPGQGGLRTVQYLDTPSFGAPTDVEAGVIALKSRSIAPPEAIRQSLEALEWLLRQGCRQILFKYCSTFDSTPQGNIGPVAKALAQRLGSKGVVACPAFPDTGRRVYQGHLFVGDRLLNESGLENHPLNPMTDADIRRWLAFQTKEPVGHIGLDTVRAGASRIAERLAAAASRGETLVIVDAIANDDLVAIGKAAAGSPLITGGSGVAIGLPGNFIAQGLAGAHDRGVEGISGPEAILAGSCSAATREQIALHKTRHPSRAIEVNDVITGKVTAGDLAAFLIENTGRAPLVYSSSTPEKVTSIQQKYGRDRVAGMLDELFAETARRLVDSGIRRLVVAGGETSGAVVSALDLKAVAIGPEIDPGVPVLVSTGKDPVALALKSGNFGAPDFFVKALERLAGR